MGLEREIKLALPASRQQSAAQWFAARTGRDGDVLPLANRYFDTPTLALSRAKAALRLRQTPHAWLQTFKTVGVATQGLHSRHEWEMPVAGPALDIDALLAACDEPAAADALRDAAPSLIELFRTDFTRRIWLIEHENVSIEGALDIGEVIAIVDGETRRAPISEIELELKRSDDDRAADRALHTLADELRAALPGLAPDDISKAQRGYMLRER